MTRSCSMVGAALALASLAGCGASQEAIARQRHAAQFECAENAIEVREIAPKTYLVTGCGPRTTYFCERANAIDDSTCIMESVESSAGEVTVGGEDIGE